jgi:hypothetical protein
LFWVTEVGLFGLEFEALYPEIPFLRVQSERMLGGDRGTLRALAQHMQLDWNERWVEHTRMRIDQWHHHSDVEVDPLLIERHPRALATAERLGYRGAEVDLEALRVRYSTRPSDRSGAA